MIAQYSDVILDDGSLVRDWRSVLTKYTKFPGIRSLHGLIFCNNSVTRWVTSKVRKLCYTGAFSDASSHVAAATEKAIPDETASYRILNKTRALSESKMTNLKQMYRDLIPSEHGFSFLNI